MVLLGRGRKAEPFPGLRTEFHACGTPMRHPRGEACEDRQKGAPNPAWQEGFLEVAHAQLQGEKGGG